MVARRKETLEQWIQGAMADTEKDGGLSQLSLVHLVGTVEEEVHTTKLEKGGTWTAKDLGQMFMRRAEVYSQDMNGLQTFRLLAFYGGRNEPQAKQRFVVSGQGEENFGVTEPPTKEGRMAQDMRLTEGVVKTALQMTASLVDKMETFMVRQGDRLEKAEERNGEVLVLMEKMIMSKYEQEMALERSRMWNDLMKKGAALAPSLVNQITGKEVFPQATEDSALLEAIAENITPEQIQAVSGILPPEVAGLLMARFRKIEAAKREEHRAMQLRPAEVEVDCPDEKH